MKHSFEATLTRKHVEHVTDVIKYTKSHYYSEQLRCHLVGASFGAIFLFAVTGEIFTAETEMKRNAFVLRDVFRIKREFHIGSFQNFSRIEIRITKFV